MVYLLLFAVLWGFLQIITDPYWYLVTWGLMILAAGGFIYNRVKYGFLCIIGLFILCPFIANATTRYVDANLGSNCSGNYSIASRNCTGSDGNAYTAANLASAIAAWATDAAGSELLLRAGTYSVAVFEGRGAGDVNGTSSSYKVIRAYNGEAVTLSGRWQISNYSWIQIGDLSGNGLRWNNATSSVNQALILQVTDETNPISCPYNHPITGASGNTPAAQCGNRIWGNNFDRFVNPNTTGSFSQGAVKIGQQNGTEVAYSVSIDVRGNNFNDLYGGTFTTSYVQYSTFQYNTYDGTSSAVPASPWVVAHSCAGINNIGHHFHHNQISNISGGTTRQGIWTDSTSGPTGACKEALIEYNRIHNVGGVGIYLEAGATNSVVRHNIVTGSTIGLKFMEQPPATQGTGNTVHHNTFSGNGTAICIEATQSGLATVYENLFVGSTRGNITYHSNSQNAVTFNRNIFPTGGGSLFSHQTRSDGNVFCSSDTANETYTNFLASVPDDGNNSQGSPSFFSGSWSSETSPGNFNLVAGSAGLNAGVSGVDIGAHQQPEITACVVENATPNRLDETVNNPGSTLTVLSQSILDPTVNAGARSATGNAVVGNSIVQITFDGSAVTAGQDVDLPAGQAGIANDKCIGTSGTSLICSQNPAVTLQCTNNVGAGAPTTVRTQTNAACHQWGPGATISPLTNRLNWAAPQNSGCKVALGQEPKILLVFQVKVTTANEASATGKRLQCRDDGGSWYVVGDTFNSHYVALVNTPQFTNLDAQTESLLSSPGGTFLNGTRFSSASSFPPVAIPQDRFTEYVFSTRFNFTNIGQTAECRVVLDGGVVFDAYTNTLTTTSFTALGGGGN